MIFKSMEELHQKFPGPAQMISQENQMQYPDAKFLVAGFDEEDELNAFFDVGTADMVLWVWIAGDLSDPEPNRGAYIDEYYEIFKQEANEITESFSMNDINQDFKQVAEQVNAKLKEAADALKEANKLAKESGVDGLICTQWTREDLWSAARNELDLAGKDPDDDEEIEKLVEQKTAVFDLFKVGELEREMSRGGWSPSASYC